jgi:hypothetical protein
MSDEGIFAEQISKMFRVVRRKVGLREHGPEWSITAFRRPDGERIIHGA